MDDSNAAACHAFHTSSLLSIQSSRGLGGGCMCMHWNPVVKPLLPTQMNGWDTQWNIFSSNWLAYLELKPSLAQICGQLFKKENCWITLPLLFTRTNLHFFFFFFPFPFVLYLLLNIYYVSPLHIEIYYCLQLARQADMGPVLPSGSFSLFHFLNFVSKYLTLP